MPYGNRKTFETLVDLNAFNKFHEEKQRKQMSTTPTNTVNEISVRKFMCSSRKVKFSIAFKYQNKN